MMASQVGDARTHHVSSVSLFPYCVRLCAVQRHQIIKELHTLYKCDCPYLISFHGAFFKEGAISIALEMMDVGSLSDVLSVVKVIDEPELAYLAKPMLQGLDYLRRAHKVHRDIKPSNICINSNAEAKLSDCQEHTNNGEEHTVCISTLFVLNSLCKPLSVYVISLFFSRHHHLPRQHSRRVQQLRRYECVDVARASAG